MRLMRLLRGESLDLLARETGQPAGRIASWREEFLAAGREGFEGPPGGDRGLRAARGPAQGRRALDGGRHPHGSAGQEGPPSVAEALEVSELLPAPCWWCAGWQACRVRRRARHAAGGAPRSRLGGVQVLWGQ